MKLIDRQKDKYEHHLEPWAIDLKKIIENESENITYKNQSQKKKVSQKELILQITK